jgi:hypothetical protein
MQQEPKIFEATDGYRARDVAAFVADYAEELAEMAGKAGLKFLAQLLTTVSMEAGSVLSTETKEQPDKQPKLPATQHQKAAGIQAAAEPP